MTHGSLFSGIGGFEQAAQWVGIHTLWSCEIASYPRRILEKVFPKTTKHEDIKQLSNPGYVDVISGGFPCQDISLAGGGVGIYGSRSGLWCEMYRIIREVRPRYVIIENSTALLFRGFERVLCDLSEIGYDAEWQCLSNADFGFDHRRERLYDVPTANKVKQRGGFKVIDSRAYLSRHQTNTVDFLSLKGFSASDRERESMMGFEVGHTALDVLNAVNPVVANIYSNV